MRAALTISLEQLLWGPGCIEPVPLSRSAWPSDCTLFRARVALRVRPLAPSGTRGLPPTGERGTEVGVQTGPCPDAMYTHLTP